MKPREKLLTNRGKNATTDYGVVGDKNQSLIGKIREVCPASKAMRQRGGLIKSQDKWSPRLSDQSFRLQATAVTQRLTSRRNIDDTNHAALLRQSALPGYHPQMTPREPEDITLEYDENAPIYLPIVNPVANNQDARDRKAQKGKKPNRRKQQNSEVFSPNSSLKIGKSGISMLNDSIFRPGKRSIYAKIRESEQVVADYRKDELELARQMISDQESASGAQTGQSAYEQGWEVPTLSALTAPRSYHFSNTEAINLEIPTPGQTMGIKRSSLGKQTVGIVGGWQSSAEDMVRSGEGQPIHEFPTNENKPYQAGKPDGRDFLAAGMHVIQELDYIDGTHLNENE